MEDAGDGGAAAFAAFAVLALALAGFAFSLLPAAERADAWLLDRQWAVLRAFAPRPAPDDIVIVGVDEASVRGVAQPVGVWNEPLGEVLVRIASARPRAIALALPLPDRSLDTLRPGLDRALMVGLAAARSNGPFVVALSIDARTRSARPIFAPYLALLGDERLGIDLLPRDADGLTRRYSLLIPTEDGGFPTLTGRLCRMLSSTCNDGLVHFALGAPFGYVPFVEVLRMRDARRVNELFHDRIVLVGETQRFSDRVAVPFNPAGWERSGRDAPGIAVHAQALRTALLGAAPEEASRPIAVLLVALAAFLVLVRDWRWALLGAGLGIAVFMGLGAAVLRSGTFLPLAPAMATLATAAAVRMALHAWSLHATRFTKRTR